FNPFTIHVPGGQPQHSFHQIISSRQNARGNITASQALEIEFRGRIERILERLKDGAAASSGFGSGVATDNRQQPAGAETGAKRRRNFQCLWWWAAAGAADAHALVPQIIQVEREERRGHIGAEVNRWIPKLIEESFLQRPLIHR